MLSEYPEPGRKHSGLESDTVSPSTEDSAREELTREDRLKQAQLEALARQASRAPIPVLLATIAIAVVVHPAVSHLLLAGWLCTIAIILLVRLRYSRRGTRGSGVSVDQRLARMVVLSMLGGSVAGVGAILFLPAIGDAEKAIVTMLMMGIASGAVSINAAYSKTYLAYVIPMLTPLASVWAAAATPEGYGIALLILMFVVLQIGFVRDNERIFRESFDIRYENERLIRELQVQREAVTRERDRAEEASRAKSRFLAAASHDLRQPLHAISLFSASLSVRSTDERTRGLAGRIGGGIAALASLLDGLLDISKLDAAVVRPEPALINMQLLIARLLEDFRSIAQSKGLTFSAGCPDNLFVYTDPVLLERIVRNLLDNAFKYTPQGGVALRVGASDGEVRISVIDTGVGIPQSEHQRVFEEFYQLSNPERDRTQGLGLGLAIVQRLMQLLGMTLALDSTPGKGSAFTVCMPRAQAPDARSQTGVIEAAEPREELPRDLRVLVVDDEAEIREGMQSLLESWGCWVAHAADVAGALGKLESASIDVVVADLRLRGDETGVALAHAAQARYGIPVLLVTGDTGRERLREAAALGLTLLHKPVSEAELHHHIARVHHEWKRTGLGGYDERSGMAVEGRGAAGMDPSGEAKGPQQRQ